MSLSPFEQERYLSYCANEREEEILKHLLDHPVKTPVRDVKGFFDRLNRKAVPPTVRLLNVAIDADARDSIFSVCAMELYGDTGYTTWTRDHEAHDFATLKSLLFPDTLTNSITFIPNGTKTSMGNLYRSIMNICYEHGYRVTIRGGTTKPLWFDIEHGTRKWSFSDLSYSTEIAWPHEDCVRRGRKSKLFHGELLLAQTWQRVMHLRDMIASETGSAMDETIAQTGVQMLRRTMGPDQKLFLPPALLRTMLDEGCGTRGGYQYARKYKGQATKVDIRRAYLSKLAGRIPYRWCWDEAIIDGVEQEGYFLCEVYGTPRIPLALGMWCSEEGAFIKEKYVGEPCYSILPSSEFAGYRAMGMTIIPRWGFVIMEWTTFENFSTMMYSILDTYADDADFMRYMKMIPNQVIGVMGRNALVTETTYSLEHPGDGWFSLLDSKGWATPHLYCRQIPATTCKLHVEISAWIYGAAKSQLFTYIEQVYQQGNTVYYVHTDGIIHSGSPLEMVKRSDYQPGDWKFEGTDMSAEVFRPGYYIFLGEKKQSGWVYETTTSETLATALEQKHAEVASFMYTTQHMENTVPPDDEEDVCPWPFWNVPTSLDSSVPSMYI